MTTSVPSESLSPVQLDLLLLSLLEGRPGDSCQQMEFTLPGILAEAAFSEAWTRLAAVEPALRVTFRTLNEDAVPEVEVASAVEPVVGVINLTESAPEVLEAALARARADERVAGVGGPTAPLWRVVAFGGSAAGTTVLLTLHAALLDERSRLRLIERFASEYAAAKEGRSSPTRPAAAYGSRLELADAISAESFWRRKLEGTAPTRVWSSGADGTAAAALDVIHTSLDTELVSAIDHLAESAGGSSETVIEAAWALVLSRASGLDEVCFGVRRPDSGVRLNGDADTLGVLDRMTTTVVEVERDLTARAWLGRLRVGRDEAWLYSAVPVARVAQWSGSLRKGAPFEIVLELDLDATEGARRQRAVEMLGLRLERTRESNGVPLALVVRRARGMSCRLDFDAARVSPTLAQGLLAGLARALAAITSCPDAPLADIRIADPLAPTVASPAAPWIGGMAAVLDDRIHESLHATAIIAGEESLTYGELKARAALVAGALRAEGIRAGDTVGLYLERGTEVAVGVLGILRAGAAWLPLDPAYPRGRVCDVLRDAGAAVLLTQRAHAGELEAAGVRELLLEDCAAAAPSEIVPVAADAPAYVIYTSGSTGKPKGVTITHGNLVHYASAIASASGLGASDRYVHTASMAFSSSVRQLMAPLAVGATVVMARRAEVADPRELLRLARERQATVLDLVPSYWARVVEALESEPMLAPATLRLALSASEPLPSNTVMRLQAQLPADIRLMNMYGQTETTGIVSTFEVGRGRAADTTGAAVVPIGRPIPGARVEVLDHLGHPLPAGISGELHVGGATVGLGYRGNAALTGERFHVGRDASLGRLFATGDLGVRDADGVLRFVGRRDTQVKIRGHRVEVEEVEAILTRHAGVSAAAVEARTSGGGAARLVAFVVSTDLPVPPRELRDHLALSVPDYMIPAAFQSLDALPRTANGKLDRAALSRLSVQFGALETAYQAPRDGAEAALTAIFTEVLGVPRVGIADHFFEMGGHSLMAIRVLARIRARFEVDLPLKTLFERPTVVALAERIRETHVPAGAQRPLAPLPAGAVAPLSFAQERLWVLNQIEPDSAAYNLVATFRLRGKLTALALEAALTEIERRHEALRTVFENVDGVARATVRAPHAFALPVEEVAAAGDRDEALRRRAAALAAVPFDLAAGPLFRGTLLRADDGDHLLVLVMHHIVSDGWSRGVLYRELGALYEAFAAGKASPLPELPIQYGDFAAWQRDRLDEPALASQLQYWTHQLAAPLPTLDLPTDRPRPPLQTFKGATRTFRIAPELAERMRALGATEDATPFMALLAGFHMLLGRYSGQQDIVVGSPTAGRTRLETESLIGFFVNTLALRGDLSGNPSFRTMLQRTRTMALDAFQYQDLPFERLVEGLHLPRDLSRSPLFQVLFILQNTPVHPLALTGITLEQVDVDAGAAKFDLTLALVAGAGGYTGHLEYNTDLFDDATIERLAGHYVHLLESAMAAPDRPIGRLGLLPASERRELLETWNDTATEYERDATIASLFEAQVRRTPAAPAASFEAETLSYAELNARANRLARHLRAEGVGPDVFVGIHLERSLEMLVAMLATLKAGGAYLPLDPAYPADRIAFMLEDSGAPVVLTQARLAHRLPALAAKIVRVDADEAQFAAFGPKDLGAGARPEDLAYVIYTSGSTGRPKGVMIEHRNVTNFFAGMDDRIGGKAPGTWLAVTSISFDISVLELFWTLTRGFHVVIQGDPERVRMQQGTPRSDRKLGLSLFYFANDAGETPDNKYQMLLESAKFADTNGFEAVWVPERHFHAFGGLYPSPAVVGAAIAAITKNVRIRTGSVVLPLHSPVRVAEDWAVVDNLSNGRVALGFASGWHDRDFVFAPQNYADRRKVMLESMDIVARLWRGETIRLPGGSGKEVEISTLPRPIQPELPMWVTAAGTPETFEMAGRIGANVLTHLLGQSPETLREKIAVYRSARKHAKHPGPGHVSLMMHTYLHEDMEEVKRVVWHPFREYLRTAVDLIKGLAEGRGQDMRSAEFTKEDMEALLDHAFHRYFDTSALMGTPESTFDTIERLKGMDVDEVCCLIDFGIPTPAVMRSLDHLAELRRQSDESSASAAADYDVPAQLERWNVTHFQCTPSMAGMLVAQPEVRPAIAGLQCLMVGGEAFPPTLADDLSKLVAGRVVNMYGPTETTIWSATHTLDGAQASVPLGTPIANTSCYVVDRDMEPVPVGVAGELLIGGDGVVRGYLKRPELSAERFIADPFTGRGRLYRTGDLVKWRADGKLDFLGRLDHQVKIRGHRIELGEIEAVLEQQPSVREVVVMAREDVPGDKRIVAYVVARAGGATPDATTLRQAVGERLPEYMVPAHIVVLERLPRTPNLKIDRKALPAPDQLATPGTAYLKPGSELEERIAEIWQEVLRVPKVGVTDNFFDIGGHSLLTVKVHSRLRGATPRPVSITDLFRFPTIRALAEHLGGAGDVAAAVVAEQAQARAGARREAQQRRRPRRPGTANE